MNPNRAAFTVLLLALAAATPARADSISLLCGGQDRFDIGTRRTILLETNGDQPVIVYSHVKITNDLFSGDILRDGKKRAVLINRKTGQLTVTQGGGPAASQCKPYPRGATAPTNRF